MKKVITKDEAIERLEKLCSRSEQCECEVSRKLYGWGIKSEDRSSIIRHLKEERFIDEKRYARSFANDKSRFSSWGPIKIKMELIKRKIPSAIINETLKNIEPSIWKEGLLKNALSKAKSLDLKGENSYEEKQKLVRYLMGRGFPLSAILKLKILKGHSESEEI